MSFLTIFILAGASSVGLLAVLVLVSLWWDGYWWKKRISKAIAERDITSLEKQLARHGPDFWDDRGPVYPRILDEAVLSEWADGTRHILQTGARTNGAFIQAMRKDSSEMVRVFLDAGVDPDSGILWAVRYEKAEMVQLLLEAGANPELEVSEQDSPNLSLPRLPFLQEPRAVSLAIANGDLAIVQLLLRAGSSISDALSSALALGADRDMFCLLLSQYDDKSHFRTLALKAGRVDVVQWIDNGRDGPVNLQDLEEQLAICLSACIQQQRAAREIAITDSPRSRAWMGVWENLQEIVEILDLVEMVYSNLVLSLEQLASPDVKSRIKSLPRISRRIGMVSTAWGSPIGGGSNDAFHSQQQRDVYEDLNEVGATIADAARELAEILVAARSSQ